MNIDGNDTPPEARVYLHPLLAASPRLLVVVERETGWRAALVDGSPRLVREVLHAAD